MGRHANPALTDSTKRLLVAGAAVLVLVGAGGAYAVTRGGASPSHASAPTTSSTATSSAAGSPSSPSPSSAPRPSSSTVAPDVLAAPLAACRTEVKAGTAVAAAAAASARDWGTHARAEVSLDAGRISYAQAEKLWAASKKPGPADLARFAAAAPVYAKAAGGCAALTKAVSSSGTTATPSAKACVARSKALAAVAGTGAKVNAQWAAHQAQMKTKVTAAGPAYHARWMTFVTDSKPVLAAYAKAAAALTKAPTCS